MWDLPRPGLEPMSPALAGRFLTTVPSGKPQIHCFWHYPWPRLICGNASSWPWCPSGIVFTRPPAQIYHSSCTSGTVVGPMEAAQTLAQASPCVPAPTKPTAAKARLIPATEAPVVCSDVLQVPNLQSQQQRCKSVTHTAMGRDFSPTS